MPIKPCVLLRSAVVDLSVSVSEVLRQGRPLNPNGIASFGTSPASSAGALKGITRSTALSIADDLGMTWREATLTRYDIWVADELFLTGTAAEIIPIVEVDARPIGCGKPGPITAKFLERFRKLVCKDGTML